MRTRFRRRSGLLLVCLLVTGCGYPEVSPAAYDCAKALYSVCNRKDAPRLDAVEDAIRDAESQGDITATEAGWLRAIVAEARNERWEEAAAEARQLMTDQVTER